MTKTTDSIFEFPCEFSVKTFGKSTDDYQKAALAIVHQHVPNLPEDCLSERPSKDGNYIALTITFTASSKAQLDAIYQDLSDNEHVVLAL
jgi:putative lipoic acid-binding regulatory protein